MTNEDFKIVKSIIDKETDINELEKIKKYIEIKNRIIDEDNWFLSKEKILKENLHDFIRKNISSENKRHINRNQIVYAVAQVKGIKTSSEVRVCDVIGIDIDNLSKQHGMGAKRLAMLELLLNRYGLSIHYHLSENDYQNLIEPTPEIKNTPFREELINQYKAIIVQLAQIEIKGDQINYEDLLPVKKVMRKIYTEDLNNAKKELTN